MPSNSRREDDENATRLVLQGEKAQVEYLVIDHAEQPSED
jgi:hypothetical protein